MIPLALPGAWRAYAAIAVIVGLVVSHGAAAWWAYGAGGDRARVTCEKRVAAINADIEKQKAELEALNKTWRDAITSLQDGYDQVAADRAKLIAGLNEKVRDYEATLSADPACRLDRSDVERLR